MAIGIGPRTGVMVKWRIYGKGSNAAYFRSKVLFMGTQKEMGELLAIFAGNKDPDRRGGKCAGGDLESSDLERGLKSRSKRGGG